MFTAGSHAHTCSHTPLTPRGGRQRCRQRPRSEAHHPLPRGQDSSLLSEPASVCSSGGTRPWRPSVPRFATVLLLPRAAPWLPPSPAVSAESCLWPELSPPSPPHCGALVHLSIHCLGGHTYITFKMKKRGNKWFRINNPTLQKMPTCYAPFLMRFVI